MSSASDHKLMLDVRKGDVAGLGVLFERHHKSLFHFFLRLTGSRAVSEDLVQEVFFRMLKYRHAYRDKSQFLAWMYQIGRHVRFDHLKKGRNEVEWDPEKEIASDSPNPDEKVGKMQEISLLHQALSQLPADKREILILSRFQKLKYHEIGAILGCEAGTVKVRVFRALRELRDAYYALEKEKAS